MTAGSASVIGGAARPCAERLGRLQHLPASHQPAMIPGILRQAVDLSVEELTPTNRLANLFRTIPSQRPRSATAAQAPGWRRREPTIVPPAPSLAGRRKPSRTPAARGEPSSPAMHKPG